MKKVLLIILDGFGIRAENDYNSVKSANTPNLNKFMKNFASGAINASEEYVGLPKGQFGNSEVGHLNLGAGRIVRQDITKIDYAIETGDFYNNSAFLTAFLDTPTGDVHIMGLLSDGGVHSHQNHIFELIKLANQQTNVRKIWVHAFLDGRDTPPQSALKYISDLEKILYANPKAQLATISGRYYAMDRDNRWDRVVLAYNAIVFADGVSNYVSPEEAIQSSYVTGVNDEFVKPTIFNGYAGMRSGDSVVFANFRADRAIQITTAITDSSFGEFSRANINLASFVTMTRYNDKINSVVAYPPVSIQNTLGEYLATLGLTQLRIAETEKYPHVTYFFNGGAQQAFAGEERILVDSPKEVATYDLKPEMSLPLVADKMLDAIKSNKYDVIISNFANGDMVGHTGNYDASIAAVEALDKYVGIVVDAMIAGGGEVLIVADHGNCEEMYDYVSHQPHTQHTTNVVPCIYIGRQASIRDGGALQDVAPTLLAMMDIAQPNEMTGKSLINFQ